MLRASTRIQVGRVLGAVVAALTCCASLAAEDATSSIELDIPIGYEADTGRGRGSPPSVADHHLTQVEQHALSKQPALARRAEDAYILCVMGRMATELEWLGRDAKAKPKTDGRLVEAALDRVGVKLADIDAQVKAYFEGKAARASEPFEIKLFAGAVTGDDQRIRDLFAPCVWYGADGQDRFQEAGLKAFNDAADPAGTQCGEVVYAGKLRPNTWYARDIELCPPAESPERLLKDVALTWDRMLPMLLALWPDTWQAEQCRAPHTSGERADGKLGGDARAQCEVQLLLRQAHVLVRDSALALEAALGAVCARRLDEKNLTPEARQLMATLQSVPPESLKAIGWTRLAENGSGSWEKLCASGPRGELGPTSVTAKATRAELNMLIPLAAKLRTEVDTFYGPPAPRTRPATVPHPMWRTLLRAHDIKLPIPPRLGEPQPANEHGYRDAVFRQGGPVSVCLVATERPSATASTTQPNQGLVDVTLYLDVPNLPRAEAQGCAERLTDVEPSLSGEPPPRRFLQLGVLRSYRWNPLLRTYLPPETRQMNDFAVAIETQRRALQVLGIPALLLSEQPRVSLDFLGDAFRRELRQALDKHLLQLIETGYWAKELAQEAQPEQVEYLRACIKPASVEVGDVERYAQALRSDEWTDINPCVKRAVIYGVDLLASATEPPVTELEARVQLLRDRFNEVRDLGVPEAIRTAQEQLDALDALRKQLAAGAHQSGWPAQMELIKAQRKAILDAAMSHEWPQDLERYRLWLDAGIGEWEKRVRDKVAGQVVGPEVEQLVQAIQSGITLTIPLPGLGPSTATGPSVVLRLSGKGSSLDINLDAWKQQLQAALNKQSAWLGKGKFAVGDIEFATEPLKLCLQLASDKPAACSARQADDTYRPTSIEATLPIAVGRKGAKPSTLTLRASVEVEGSAARARWQPVSVSREDAIALEEAFKDAARKALPPELRALIVEAENSRAALDNWLSVHQIELLEDGLRVRTKLHLPLEIGAKCEAIEQAMHVEATWRVGQSAPKVDLAGDTTLQDRIKDCAKKGLAQYLENWANGLSGTQCDLLDVIVSKAQATTMQACALDPKAGGDAKCRMLDDAATRQAFCAQETEAKRPLHLAFIAPAFSKGKPRIAAGGFMLETRKGRAHLKSSQVAMLAAFEGGSSAEISALCEVPLKQGDSLRLNTKVWTEACGRETEFEDSADLLVNALGIDTGLLSGDQVRAWVMPRALSNGLAIELHADLSGVSLGIPVSLPGDIVLGDMSITSEGIDGKLADGKAVIDALKKTLQAALVGAINDYLASIDLGLDDPPKVAIEGRRITAEGSITMDVFGTPLPVTVYVDVHPRFDVRLDEKALKQPLHSLGNLLLGELATLAGGQGIEITEPRVIQDPIGAEFALSVTAMDLGKLEFRRVVLDLPGREVRIEFPVQFMLSTDILIPPVAICQPYFRIEDRKLSALTIGANITAVACAFQTVVKLQSSVKLSTANPISMRMDAVLVLFSMLNLADAYGEVDKNGLRFKARVLPPVNRVIGGDIIGAVGRFEEFEGTPVQVSPKEGAFAHATITVFGVPAAEGLFYANTRGRVLIQSRLDVPLTHLDVLIASESFPSDLELTADANVKVGKFKLAGVEVEASEGYAGAGFTVLNVGLFVDTPGLRALTPEALLRAIEALLQFKIDIGAIKPEDLEKLLSEGVKLKLSPAMGSKSGEKSTKKKRSTKKKSEPTEPARCAEGQSCPESDEKTTPKKPAAPLAFPPTLTPLEPKPGKGKARSDRYFKGGSGGGHCDGYVTDHGSACFLRFGLDGGRLCSGPTVFPHTPAEPYRGTHPWIAAVDPLGRHTTITESTTVAGHVVDISYSAPTTKDVVGDDRRRVPVRWVQRNEGGSWAIMRMGPNGRCDEVPEITTEQFVRNVPDWSFDTMLAGHSNPAVYRGRTAPRKKNDDAAIQALAWAWWSWPAAQSTELPGPTAEPGSALYRRYAAGVPEAAGSVTDVHVVSVLDDGRPFCDQTDSECVTSYKRVFPAVAEHSFALSSTRWNTWFPESKVPAERGAPPASKPSAPDYPAWDAFIGHIYYGGPRRLVGTPELGAMVGPWKWDKPLREHGALKERVSDEMVTLVKAGTIRQVPVLAGRSPHAAASPLGCREGQTEFLTQLAAALHGSAGDSLWVYTATASDDRAAVALWANYDGGVPTTFHGQLQAQDKAGCPDLRSPVQRFQLERAFLEQTFDSYIGAKCWPEGASRPQSLIDWIDWFDLVLTRATPGACPSLVSLMESSNP